MEPQAMYIQAGGAWWSKWLHEPSQTVFYAEVLPNGGAWYVKTDMQGVPYIHCLGMRLYEHMYFVLKEANIRVFEAGRCHWLAAAAPADLPPSFTSFR